MAHLRIANDRPDQEVTAEHKAASIEVLEQLCREVSSPRVADRRLYVRVGHYEQPGFLNPQLFGFWMFPRMPDSDSIEPVVGLDELGMEWAVDAMREWASQGDLERLVNGPVARIQEPGSSSEESPSVWAVVLNTPIETQIESTLTALAMLVARRGVSQQLDGDRVDELSGKAELIDAETTKLISEEIRNHGWRNACKAIHARAERSGHSLHVDYVRPLFGVDASRRRMNLARHAYNTFPGAREAIDKVVGVLTQHWTIAGSAPEQLLQTLRNQFETSGIPVLTAHAVRDSLVCGVGALSLASVPVRNPWLLAPESIEKVDGESAVVNLTGEPERIRPVLQMTGARQVDSDLGLSILEPLIVSTAKHDLYLRSLLDAKILNAIPAARNQVGEFAERLEILAKSELRSLELTTQSVFNPAALRMSSPSSDLYTPGMEEMTSGIGAISIGPRPTV